MKYTEIDVKNIMKKYEATENEYSLMLFFR